MLSDVERAIGAALEEIGAVHQAGGPGTWRVEVPCVARRSVTVGMAARERTLALQAFLMRAPDRRRALVHERLLRKQMDADATGPWRFAIDEHGDVYVLASLPLAGFDTAVLDGVLGTLSGLVDAVFPGLMNTGFVVPTRPDGPPTA